jgi:hypothetical protein
MWMFGGFTNLVDNEEFAYGLGLFSYNLNGLINPQGWSVFINDLSMLPEQYEGFSYLGLGAILMILISTILLIIWFIKDKEILKKYKNLIISFIFIFIISTFVALSPKAYIGEYLLYELKLPDFIMDLWGIFRSTGRFIWPVIYILMISSVIIIVKRLNWKYSLAVLTLCTVVQIMDIGPILLNFNEFYNQEFQINEEFDLYSSETLKKVSYNDDIELLVLVSDNFYDSDKMLYSDWAINNNLKTNTMHFARTTFNDILKDNTINFLENKSESEVFVFTSKKECSNYDLYCYKLPNNYYLGYINELD